MRIPQLPAPAAFRIDGGPARVLAAAALALALAPARSSAQPDAGEPVDEPAQRRAAAPPSDVEVIRIKGRPVTSIETEVPASVTQFAASDLQALGAQNVSDLAKVTPNVEIKTSGSTAPTFFIRGVGLSDFSANAAGAVGIYRDDVPINAPAIQLIPIFDLENVEVLRGPQATGAGRNSSAGAIKMYARRPTGDLNAELRTSFGNFDAKDFEGAVEAPIYEEILSTRLAFRWTERGPIGTNRCGGITDPSIADVPVTDPNDPRLPALPPPQPAAPNVARIQGPDFKSYCHESNQNATIVQNPRFSTGYRHTPPPPPAINQPNTDAEGDPRRVRISRLAGNFVPTDVNDLGNWAARGQLRFQPPDLDMDWLLNLHGTRVAQLSTLGQAMGTDNLRLGSFTQGQNYQEPDNAAELDEITGGGPQTNEAYKELGERLARRLDIHPYTGDYNRVGDTTLDTWGATLRGDWTVGSVTFTSISGYDRYWRSRDTDQDFTPEVYFESVSQDDAWQYYQELKAHGELPETPVRWNLGGYYLMEILNFEDTTFTQVRPTDRNYTQKLYSGAVYTGFEWDFLDDFTLEGGVRWNWDRKDFDFAVTTAGNTNTTQEDLIGKAPTGTISLNYRFSDEVSTYWKYSHGWKPGTFNSIAQTCVGVVARCGVTVANPEMIDAWETGLRGTWFDGRLQASSSLFFYKYADYQVFVLSDSFFAAPSLQIVNANDAQVYGAELELRVEPLVDLVPPEIEGLVLSARGGWLESEFLDFTVGVQRPGGFEGVPTEVLVDYSGNQLINSPRFKVSAVLEWTFDLGRFGAVIPRYDFAWTSDIYFDPNEGLGTPNSLGETFLPEYAVGQRRYWLHNVRLGYRVPEGNIEIAGWCRNLTNEIYKSYAFDATSFSKLLINFPGEPRTYGLEATFRF